MKRSRQSEGKAQISPGPELLAITLSCMNRLVADKRADLESICRRHQVRRIDLFGSAAGDEFDPASSDLDFLVAFEELQPDRYADAYFGLLEDLQSLFQRPVDLVVDSAIKNPYFRQSVDKTRTVLYAA
jgi:predicted nucleotidyltransferase